MQPAGDGDTADAGPAPRPLLVVGAPRSGTTLVGSYLGSATGVLNLGEYGGFHLARSVAPLEIGRFPSRFRDAYLEGLAIHARAFADHLAVAMECDWYCDSTPWNLLVAGRLLDDLPDALVVLVLRHVAGTFQSLRRAHADGYPWAGRTWDDTSRLWARFGEAAAAIPDDRLVVLSYDRLLADPDATLDALHTELAGRGFPTGSLDRRMLCVSHATGTRTRPTLGTIEDGVVRLRPLPSWDREGWSGDIHRAVWAIAGPAHAALRARFGDAYPAPSPPPPLRAHDAAAGLVEVAVEGW